MRVSIAEVFLLAGVPLLAGCPVFGCGGEQVGTHELSVWDVDLAPGDVDADGNLDAEACLRLCGELGVADVTGCTSTPDTDTGGYAFTLECEGTITVYCEGRRPPGFQARRAGNVWLRRAELEAASIHAFLRLHRELAAHGAPAEVSDRCLAAARDGVRHTRAMAHVAGAPVPRPRVRKQPLRSLAAIARDNAVEGCVHETWAAAVANLHPHPVYRAIAADEARHAQLAWDIDAWLGERARPDLRRRAGARLVATVPPEHRALAERLAERLWA